MPVHTDDDAFLSCVGVFDTKKNAKVKKDSEILAYMCFPLRNLRVALRHGDVIFFNPLEAHCISSKAVDRDILCASLYCKTAQVGLNCNSIPLSNGVKLQLKQNKLDSMITQLE